MAETIVPFADLAGAELRPGWIYEGSSAGGYGGDPIHKVVPGVGNAGGIRISGSISEPSLVALFSTTEHADWPDVIDDARRTIVYHGDNRQPGPLLGPKGNRSLRAVFERGFADEKARLRTPPFFVFSSAKDAGAHPRSVRYHGLAVPGPSHVAPEDWLVAKWFDTVNGRFENYVVTLTLLAVDVISHTWIEELTAGEPVGSHAPEAFRKWVEDGQVGP